MAKLNTLIRIVAVVAILIVSTTSLSYSQATLIIQTGPTSHASYDASGKYIVAIGDSKAHTWDAESGQLVAEILLTGANDLLDATPFGSDGNVLIVERKGAPIDSVRCWNWKANKIIWAIPGHYAAGSTSGNTVVVLGVDDTLWTVDATTGNRLNKLAGYVKKSNDMTLRVSENGAYVVWGGLDSSIFRIMDLRSRQIIRTDRLDQGGSDVRSVRFSTDETNVLYGFARPFAMNIVSGDTTVKLPDLGRVYDLDITADHKYMATISIWRDIVRWDAATGTLIDTIGKTTGLGTTCVFSPDGKHILTSAIDGSITVWPVPTISAVETAPRATAGGVSLTAYPDPARDQLVVHYSMSTAGSVRLALLNSLGDVVLSIEHATEEAGEHQEVLDTRGLASGVYLLRVQAGGRQTARTVRVQH
ncbi:MAG TPA: T9SS type A sorting domain-containing protein [Candidatus Paceibacterota bacterium]|nr:T9SS type A sorting domain-containing protein [Candidatus Paceibacterota bacterium]